MVAIITFSLILASPNPEADLLKKLAKLQKLLIKERQLHFKPKFDIDLSNREFLLRLAKELGVKPNIYKPRKIKTRRYRSRSKKKYYHGHKRAKVKKRR